MRTKQLPLGYDVLAPDGSEIRELLASDAVSVVHCTLTPGAISAAVRHRSVTEIWYVTEGSGQVWRRTPQHDEVVDVAAGIALDIPTGAHFQFRNTGTVPLRILIVTTPRWPGEDEAVRVPDHWTTAQGPEVD